MLSYAEIHIKSAYCRQQYKIALKFRCVTGIARILTEMRIFQTRVAGRLGAFVRKEVDWVKNSTTGQGR